jgi:hypothetical protein
LKQFLRNRRGLGAPVGNLIILVAAVILSTSVVLFATNMTASQVTKETLFIPSSHIWYVNGNFSVAAVAITDTGATDIVVAKLEVKGLTCQWSGNESYVVYTRINGTLPGDLPFVGNFTGNATVTIAGQEYVFSQAGTGLTLKAGETVVFYAAVPNRMMLYDLARPVNIMLSTSQSVYCTEALVESGDID